MTDLVIRKIPCEFDASVPFDWQAANPEFGVFGNAFTFVAGLGRYLGARIRPWYRYDQIFRLLRRKVVAC